MPSSIEASAKTEGLGIELVELVLRLVAVEGAVVIGEFLDDRLHFRTDRADMPELGIRQVQFGEGLQQVMGSLAAVKTADIDDPKCVIHLLELPEGAKIHTVGVHQKLVFRYAVPDKAVPDKARWNRDIISQFIL